MGAKSEIPGRIVVNCEVISTLDVVNVNSLAANGSVRNVEVLVDTSTDTLLVTEFPNCLPLHRAVVISPASIVLRQVWYQYTASAPKQAYPLSMDRIDQLLGTFDTVGKFTTCNRLPWTAPNSSLTRKQSKLKAKALSLGDGER